MRVHQDDPKTLLANSQWAFADCATTLFPGTPSTTNVCLNGGFETKARRLAAGDPPASLEGRYPTDADYVARVTAAAKQLAGSGCCSIRMPIR